MNIRRVVFVCTFYVLMCCAIFVVGKNTAQAEEAQEEIVESQAETTTKIILKENIEYYESFLKNASDVMGEFVLASKNDLEKCGNYNTSDEKEQLKTLKESIMELKKSTDDTLRPLKTGGTFKTLKELNEGIVDNKIQLTPKLFTAVKTMTVSPDKIATKIVEIQQMIKKLEDMHNNKNCHKLELTMFFLRLSVNPLEAMKTAAEGAKNWQEEFFKESNSEIKEEGNVKKEEKEKEGEGDEIDQTEEIDGLEDEEENELQLNQPVVSSKNKNNKIISKTHLKDGSGTQTPQCAVIFCSFFISVCVTFIFSAVNI